MDAPHLVRWFLARLLVTSSCLMEDGALALTLARLLPMVATLVQELRSRTQDDARPLATRTVVTKFLPR